jgi:hypothetical protein
VSVPGDVGQGGRLRELRLLCFYGSFILEGALWSRTSPPELEVASSRDSCGTGATTPLSPEEARRCRFEGPYQGLHQDTAY